jgi:hypothetical protein
MIVDDKILNFISEPDFIIAIKSDITKPKNQRFIQIKFKNYDEFLNPINIVTEHAMKDNQFINHLKLGMKRIGDSNSKIYTSINDITNGIYQPIMYF